MIVLFVVVWGRRSHGPAAVSRGWTISQGSDTEARGEIRARGILEVVGFVTEFDVTHAGHR